MPTRNSNFTLRRLLAATLAMAFVSTAAADVARAGSAADEEVVGMVWRHSITTRTEKSRIKKYGVGPQADGQSRLETELRAAIPLKRLPEARAMMDNLSANGAAAEAVFGKNTRVMKLHMRPRKVWDIYLDTTDGKLAKNNAALRIRIENGTAQLNYKPPGGVFLPEGLKIGVENGITLNADPVTGQLPASVVAFFNHNRLVDNPLREIRKQFPGLQIEDFFFEQLQVKQNRQIYEVQELQQDGSWQKKSEVSVDRVMARDPGNKFRTVYGRVELEGDHVAAGALSSSQLAAASNRPHRSRDAQNKSFNASADVLKIRGYVAALTKFLKVTPVTDSKYVHSRARLAAKGATFNTGRHMIKGYSERTASRRARTARTARTARAPRRAPR
jgi:hypothetical protein